MADNVLLILIGESPAVVAETLFGLWRNDVRTGTICGLTTSGCLRYRQRIERDVSNFNLDYATAWRCENGWLKAYIDDNGRPLADIVSKEQMDIAANHVLREVRQVVDRRQQQGDANSLILHASIAGGRRSTAVAMQQIMSWYAGPEDTLSHVAAYEEKSNRWAATKGRAASDFSYPEVSSRPKGRAVNGGIRHEPTFNQEQCELFSFSFVPFVRLPFYVNGLLPPILQMNSGLTYWLGDRKDDAITGSFKLHNVRIVVSPSYSDMVNISELLLAREVRLAIVSADELKSLVPDATDSDWIKTRMHGLGKQSSRICVSSKSSGITVVLPIKNGGAGWFAFLCKYANLGHTAEAQNAHAGLTPFTYSTSAFKYRYRIAQMFSAFFVEASDDGIQALANPIETEWPNLWRNEGNNQNKELRSDAVSESARKSLFDEFFNPYFGKKTRPCFRPKDTAGALWMEIDPDDVKLIPNPNFLSPIVRG